MLEVVVQHVPKCVADLPEALEHAGVEAFGEDFALAIPKSIQRLAHSATEALCSASQCVGVISFDDEVDVIALDREVDDAKAISLGLAKRFDDGSSFLLVAKMA